MAQDRSAKIILMIKWIWTSRLSTKNSLYVGCGAGVLPERVGKLMQLLAVRDSRASGDTPRGRGSGCGSGGLLAGRGHGWGGGGSGGGSSEGGGEVEGHGVDVALGEGGG